MQHSARVCKPLGIAVAVLLLALPASAQIQDALQAYTGANAKGYMQPIVDAFGADLNDAFYHSAYIPSSGGRVSLEVAVMSVIFEDEDKTFEAQTEGGFSPQTTFTAPTIVGSGESVTVSGDAGTQFTAPGGFDLNSFALAVPQLRLGVVKGTEAVVRFIAVDISDNEIGEIDLFGIGIRHSITQYFSYPIDIAIGAMWQSFSMGNDFIDSNAFTAGIQGSKRLALFEPYAGVAWDRFQMDMTFDSEVTGGEPEKVEFDAMEMVRVTAVRRVQLCEHE